MSLNKFSIPLIVLFSTLIALSTLRVFPLGLDLAFQGMDHQINNAKLMFLLHIGASSAALFLGAIQMIKALRRKALGLHRWFGRAYALAVALGGISGLLIAFEIDGALSTLGFALLAALWLITTAKAVSLARARKIAEHRRWMICSFALTFAAVTLRLQLLVFALVFAMPYEVVYPVLAWFCWVPNIAFALWYIRRAPLPI